MFTVYSKNGCPWCVKAKEWMADNGLAYDEIVMDDQSQRNEFYDTLQNGQGSVPQIFLGERHIGGYTDLMREAPDLLATLAVSFDIDF